MNKAIFSPDSRSPQMRATGYDAKTTFWNDFSIADRFGMDAVKDTYNRAYAEWKDNVIYMAELVMVLNHKIWQWYEKKEAMAKLYNDLWEQLDRDCCERFTGDDLALYYKITD